MRMVFIILGSVLLLGGCSSATSEPANPVPTTSVSAVATPSAAMVKGLSVGMPYMQMRDRLLHDDWLPLQSADCSAHAGRPQMCRRWLELQDCDSARNCNMTWADKSARQLLHIKVQNVAGDGDAGDPGAGVKVAQWRLASVTGTQATAHTAACPSTDFAAFLPAFAANASVRQAFTAPLVRSNVLISDGEGDRMVAAYVRGDDPDVFNLSYSGEAFHHVGVDGIDPEALKLEIKAEGNDTRDVSYLYGSSEGRGFRFTRQHACWYLTGNPQPTAP